MKISKNTKADHNHSNEADIIKADAAYLGVRCMKE